MPSPRISDKTLAELPRRLIRFAEIYSDGKLNILQSALFAGYSEKVAHKQAYRWIGRDRQSSQFPHLWDYYEKLRQEKLRLYKVDVDTIVNELKLIAFSDITKYIDIPTDADLDRTDLIERIESAQAREFVGAADKADLALLAKYDEKKLDELRRQNKRRGNSIKLKSRDDIPSELTPAISELHETREGIRIKLHNKTDAIDKLARWLKMYTAERPADEAPISSVAITLEMKGSKSRLLGPTEEDQEAA